MKNRVFMVIVADSISWSLILLSYINLSLILHAESGPIYLLKLGRPPILRNSLLCSEN